MFRPARVPFRLTRFRTGGLYPRRGWTPDILEDSDGDGTPDILEDSDGDGIPDMLGSARP
jgi:hypothetical protein